MDENNELIVGGYHFNSLADADKARDEQKKIAYIESHLNMDNPESVLVIYNKMLSNKIFVTPVGLGFLHEIREYLLSREEIESESVKPLELNQMYALGRSTASEDPDLPKRRVVPAEKKNPYEERFFISAVLNAILIVAVIVMFIIATTSDNPNIINYENAIVNRYAEWEEDLKVREQRVKDAERALEMEESGE